MRHKKGIQLVRHRREEITYVGPVMDPSHDVFEAIPDHHALGGHCSSCERTGWVDRWEIARKFGNRTYLSSLRQHLRCLGCGNKKGNVWILGKLPR